MDEDRLSPRLGRLIDEAKAAARRAGPDSVRPEGVALLTAAGTVHVGCSGGPQQASAVTAVEQALEEAVSAGKGEILAAAFAVPADQADTVLPGEGSRRALAAIDADLQLVYKCQGRWVMRPLSEVACTE